MPFPNFEKLLPAVDLSGLPEEEKQRQRDLYMDKARQSELDYVSGLSKTDDALNRNTFQGLLKRIFVKCGRPDYYDLVLMQELEIYYTDLCARYQQPVTLERFCIMIGCSRFYFDVIMDEARKRGLSGHITLGNFLQTEVVSSLQDGALSGNPGFMFVLKARHGWSDQPTPGGGQPEQQSASLEQIAAAVGVSSVEPLPLPETAGETVSQGDIIDV